MTPTSTILFHGECQQRQQHSNVARERLRGALAILSAGELSRTIGDTSREPRLERMRPDGRIIEVRRNPVPGSGFVLIFADFTERKRAEEAIRSARDDAESALRELQTARASLVHAQKMAALRQGFAGGDFDGIDPPLPRSTILRFSDCARSMVAAADFPISRIPAGEAVDSSRLGNPDGSSSCPKTTRYAL